MKKPGADDGVVVALPIRVRRTEYGQGESTEVCSVACPLAGTNVSISRCEGCERAEGVIAGEAGRALLQCRLPIAALGNESPPPSDLSEKLRRTKVSEVMTSSVTCVDSELEVDELSRIFQTRGLREAPVVEDQGVLLGMVSLSDLMRGRAVEAEDTHFPPDCVGLLVEDIMSGEKVTLQETSSLAEAAELLAARKLHRVAVVSESDVVVGILSLVDLARWLARQG